MALAQSMMFPYPAYRTKQEHKWHNRNIVSRGYMRGKIFYFFLLPVSQARERKWVRKLYPSSG
jgi:hypothetical protein